MPPAQSGALAGRDALHARATMVVDGLPTDIVVEGRIELS